MSQPINKDNSYHLKNVSFHHYLVIIDPSMKSFIRIQLFTVMLFSYLKVIILRDGWAKAFAYNILQLSFNDCPSNWK